jgi:hypothetical protein
MKLYVNGAIVSTTVTSDNLTATIISSEKVRVGMRIPSTSGYFNGKIGIIQIYNRELNPYEIAENFQATRGRYGL